MKKLYVLSSLVLLIVVYSMTLPNERALTGLYRRRGSPTNLVSIEVKKLSMDKNWLDGNQRKHNDGAAEGSSTLPKGESSKSRQSVIIRRTTEVPAMSSGKKVRSSSNCLEWVSLVSKPPYYLTAVLLVRIYEEDKAKLTTAELKMWLLYLKYAGVQHVYIYDAFVFQNESQLPHLKKFLKEGYITYIDWHKYNPYTITGTQVKAYQQCIDDYRTQSKWQTAIDIDEYPFSPKDPHPGFFLRYMKQYEKAHPDVTELSMQNFLFLGKPLKKELLIERMKRRTRRKSNVLSKPVYKPLNIYKASIHHNDIQTGNPANAPVKELRLNHYWGARLQNWGEDTEEILQMTVPDDSMEPIIEAFKKCETFVHHYLS